MTWRASQHPHIPSVPATRAFVIPLTGLTSAPSESLLLPAGAIPARLAPAQPWQLRSRKPSISVYRVRKVLSVPESL